MPVSAPDLAARLALAENIAREAGALAFSYFKKLATLDVEFKLGGQDVVSIADRDVEALIRKRIAASFPDDGVLGEEEGMADGNSEALWVVDPIDGTSPFLHAMTSWCVSIAVVVDGKAVIGVIHVPTTNELFSASTGGGAFLNGVPIHVEPNRTLADGLLGFGAKPRIPPRDTARFVEALLEVGGMFYRNGSGALMLAYVACGRLVGYFEHHINSWDCLAGLCLIQEAGGWQEDFLADGGLNKGKRIVAGAPQTEAGLRALMAKAGVV